MHVSDISRLKWWNSLVQVISKSLSIQYCKYKHQGLPSASCCCWKILIFTMWLNEIVFGSFTVVESNHFCVHFALHGSPIWPIDAVSWLEVECFLFDSWNVLQYNYTPLHIASLNGHTELCRYLRSAGAGVDRVNQVSINLRIEFFVFQQFVFWTRRFDPETRASFGYTS